MSYAIIGVPVVCILLGWLTLGTLAGPERGAPPAAKHLPKAGPVKPRAREKTKTK